MIFTLPTRLNKYINQTNFINEAITENISGDFNVLIQKYVYTRINSKE